MKLRSICVGVASGCCVLGLVAILWTLIIQEIQNNYYAIQHPDESIGRLKRSIVEEENALESRHSENIAGSKEKISLTNYGWKRSFGKDDLLYKFYRTLSKWIRGDDWPPPGIESKEKMGDTGIRGVEEQLRTIAPHERVNENIHTQQRQQRRFDEKIEVGGARHGDENTSHRHRTKRDTSRNRFRTLDLASKGDTQIINLITPNPEIEITIEVVDDEGDQGDWETIEEGAPSRGVPSPPSDEVRGSDTSENGWLNVMRPTEVDFDNDPSRITTHWGQWSPCTTTCGGGTRERARYCGVNCVARVTQDCNRMSCPSPDSPTKSPLLVNTTTPTSQSTTDVLSNVMRLLDPNDFRTDSCSAWMSCRNEKLVSHLSRLNDLPGCPCEQPRNLHRNDAIFDEEKGMVFRWAAMAVDKDWLDIYKPTASHCIQSLLSPMSTRLAAQQCCYELSGRLITRGPGAGTPNLISSEISPELNYKIDIMPWIICKGDWTKYNLIRPPNNALDCPVSPDDDDFRRYWLEAKEY